MKKEKSILYVIQASSRLPKIYNYLNDKPYLLLSYKTKTKDTTLFSPNSTWTTGRNELLEYIWANNLRYDYYLFMDEDIIFNKMSQKDGFKFMTSVLSQVNYPIVTGQFFGYRTENNKKYNIQTISSFDAAFNSFSQEAVFNKKIFPYEDKYDSISWWNSQHILIYKANYYYHNQIIQCNKIKIINTQHGDYPQKKDQTNNTYSDLLAEMKVDSIKMSDLKEVKTDIKFRYRVYFLLVKYLFMTKIGNSKWIPQQMRKIQMI